MCGSQEYFPGEAVLTQLSNLTTVTNETPASGSQDRIQTYQHVTSSKTGNCVHPGPAET